MIEADKSPRLRELAAAARRVALDEFSVEATTRELAAWAQAPAAAPDAALRGALQSPRDHAPLRSRITSLAERLGIARLLRSR